jgi:hypothetical protein
MNFLEAVSQIFPEGVMVTDDTPAESTIGVEVHDLPKNTVPKNCEVIASGQFQYFVGQESRNSYLIKVQELVLMVRMLPCTGSSSRLYAEVRLQRQPIGFSAVARGHAPRFA